MAFQSTAEKIILRSFILTSILRSSLIFGAYGDCSSPPLYENAYVQRTSGLMVGSTVVYGCVEGYQMKGLADSVVLICSSEGNWVGPEIDCSEKISCSTPFYPAYGSYNVTVAGLEYQSTVTFSCQDGYQLEGSQSVLCTSSGLWLQNVTTVTAPKCIRTCSEEGFRYLYHECYERMDSTGTWNFAKGNCELTGGQLAIIKDAARQSFVEGVLRGQPSFYWIGGFENDRDWKYLSDGHYANYFNWAPGEPSTSGENCVYLSNVNGPENSLKWNDEYCYRSFIETTPPINIYSICETAGNCSSLSITYSKYQYENRCLLFIDDAPRDQPSSKTKCINDFGGNLVEIKSHNMQQFIETIIHDNDFEIANWWIGLEEGFDRTWSWVDGERITQFFWGDNEPSNPSENCLDILPVLDYKWNDDNCDFIDRDHICQYGETRCGNPGTPYHGNLTTSKGSYPIGETIYFSCDDGYTLSDPLMGSLTCQNDSNWSGTLPECHKMNCSGPIPEIPNTFNVSLSTEYRGIILYECLDRYIPYGYPVSICQEDGTWSIPNATCTERTLSTTDNAPTEITWTEMGTLNSSTAPSPTVSENLPTDVTVSFSPGSSTISKTFSTSFTRGKTTKDKYTSMNLRTTDEIEMTTSSSISSGSTLFTTNNIQSQSSASENTVVTTSLTTTELTKVETSYTTLTKRISTGAFSKTPSVNITYQTTSPEVTARNLTTTAREGTSGISSPSNAVKSVPAKTYPSSSRISSTASSPTKESFFSSIATTTTSEPSSLQMTSEQQQSEQQSVGYSKEPVSTKEPSKGLIIGLSVTAGVIGVVVVFIFLSFFGVFKFLGFPSSKSTQRPLDDGFSEYPGSLTDAGTTGQKSETTKNITDSDTPSGESLPQEVVFQMTDIKPLIHTDV